MVGEEKVDKTLANASANKTSDVPANAPASTAAKAPVGATRHAESFICEECGKSFPTKHALSGHMSAHSKKSETIDEDLPDEFLDERETLDRIIAEATPTRKRKAIVRMASRHLGDKRESMEMLAEALRLADIPVHLRNLILNNWASHMDVADIEDILDIEKKDEKKKPEEKKTDEDRAETKKTGDPVKEVFKKYKIRKAERLEDLMNTKEIADMEREMGVGKEEEKKEEEKKHTLIVDGVSLKVTAEELLSWKRYLLEQKRDEEEREERKEERKERQRLIDERQPQNDGGLVEWVVGEGNNTRTIKVRPETIPLLMQAQGSNPSPPSAEEVAQMVERTIEAQAKKLTTDDVERIVQRAMSSYSPSALTKNDLLYLEARDKLKLEEKKLDESGKTRDVISNGIRDGFGHAGKIIARMMTEEGGGAGMPMKGYSDQAGNMMQIACPGCNSVITAPIGSPMVTCPGCGKRWTVERPEQQQQPPKAEEKKPPAEEFASKEKKAIQKSMEDAKKPLETFEQTSDASDVAHEPVTSDAPAIIPEQTSDAQEVTPGAEKKVEEELKKEEIENPVVEPATQPPQQITQTVQIEKPETKPPEQQDAEQVKKPWPKIDSNICPFCGKKCKGKRGVSVHITVVHPEYKK